MLEAYQLHYQTVALVVKPLTGQRGRPWALQVSAGAETLALTLNPDDLSRLADWCLRARWEHADDCPAEPGPGANALQLAGDLYRRRRQAELRAEEIIAAVAGALDYLPHEIRLAPPIPQSISGRRLVLARSIAAALLRLDGMTWEAVAEVLNFHHASAMNAPRRLRDQIRRGREIACKIAGVQGKRPVARLWNYLEAVLHIFTPAQPAESEVT